jgi:hypothetical protein
MRLIANSIKSSVLEAKSMSSLFSFSILEVDMYTLRLAGFNEQKLPYNTGLAVFDPPWTLSKRRRVGLPCFH